MEEETNTIEGVVQDIDSDLKKIFATIQDNKQDKTQTVDLPIKINNLFELIPYQTALIGERVRYSIKETMIQKGFPPYKSITRKYTLEILTGMLTGKQYIHRKFE